MWSSRSPFKLKGNVANGDQWCLDANGANKSPLATMVPIAQMVPIVPMAVI
jgi:hypothetical protein